MIGYIEDGHYVIETPTPFNLEQEDSPLQANITYTIHSLPVSLPRLQM